MIDDVCKKIENMNSFTRRVTKFLFKR